MYGSLFIASPLFVLSAFWVPPISFMITDSLLKVWFFLFPEWTSLLPFKVFRRRSSAQLSVKQVRQTKEQNGNICARAERPVKQKYFLVLEIDSGIRCCMCLRKMFHFGLIGKVFKSRCKSLRSLLFPWIAIYNYNDGWGKPMASCFVLKCLNHEKKLNSVIFSLSDLCTSRSLAPLGLSVASVVDEHLQQILRSDERLFSKLKSCFVMHRFPS